MEELELHFKTEKEEDKVRHIPYLSGPPGIGKSAIAQQFVERINEADIKNGGSGWILYHLRLGQCDPTDLKGVPVYLEFKDGSNSVRKFCSFAPPIKFPVKGV